MRGISFFAPIGKAGYQPPTLSSNFYPATTPTKWLNGSNNNLKTGHLRPLASWKIRLENATTCTNYVQPIGKTKNINDQTVFLAKEWVAYAVLSKKWRVCTCGILSLGALTLLLCKFRTLDISLRTFIYTIVWNFCPKSTNFSPKCLSSTTFLSDRKDWAKKMDAKILLNS